MKQLRDKVLSFAGEGHLKPTFAFSDNIQDEFFIDDGNERIGIFKVWPARIVNILEGKKIDESHLQRLVELRKWLSFVMLNDKILQEFFSGQSSEDDLEQVGILFNQMETAFKLFEPFYAIEAMVDNKVDKKNMEGEVLKIKKGGEIDLVALMLPGILSENLGRCNNYDDIEKEIENMKSSFEQDNNSVEGKKFVLLSLVSRKLGISFREVVFASNRLTQVSGSAVFNLDDLDRCITILQKSFRRNKNSGNKNSIDADINARLRFMNWLPSRQSESNFDWGNMNYDSVCATAGKLFEMILANPSLIREGRRGGFDGVKNQLINLDASSARGRFILQMFNDEILSDEFINSISVTKTKARDIVSSIETDKFVEDINDHISLQQAGGKGLGIFLAKSILAKKNEVKIPETNTIPWTWVFEWLNEIPDFENMLRRLDENPDSLDVLDTILEGIDELEIPNDLLAILEDIFEQSNDGIMLRSSALIEDTEDIGSAPGVFDSYPANSKSEIISGVKGVVKSFFSTKAVQFRKINNLSNTPLISVLVQSQVKGIHGAVFVADGNINIDISSSNVNNHDNKIKNISFPIDGEQKLDNIQERLADIARKSFHIFGPVDIEFIIKDNIIHILQLRMLDHKNGNGHHNENVEEIVDIKIESIEDFVLIKDDNTNLIIGEQIDLNRFQSELLTNIIKYSGKICSITISVNVAQTSHFSNIINTLGIILIQP